MTLDTHTLIWFMNGSIDLSAIARKRIESGENFVSIASIWEIAIKISAKKLDLNTSFNEFIYQFSQNNFILLPISIADTFSMSELPFYHKDPFDRIIIAQSQNNGLAVISKD